MYRGASRVIHDPPLEPGWLGKPNAMQKALETVNAEFVLFGDADMRHTPGCKPPAAPTDYAQRATSAPGL